MNSYARIQRGEVVELFDTDGEISEMFHPDLQWVECNGVDGIGVGWRYEAGTFLPPLGATLESQKADKASMVTALIRVIEDKQARSVREIMLALASGQAFPAASVSRLQSYEDEISSLRADLAAIQAASTQAQLDAVSTS